jgi:hypothetical protein
MDWVNKSYLSTSFELRHQGRLQIEDLFDLSLQPGAVVGIEVQLGLLGFGLRKSYATDAA